MLSSIILVAVSTTATANNYYLVYPNITFNWTVTGEGIENWTEYGGNNTQNIAHSGYQQYFEDYVYLSNSSFLIYSWNRSNVQSTYGGAEVTAYIDYENNRLVVQTYSGAYSYQEQYSCGSYCCGWDWLGNCNQWCTSWCWRTIYLAGSYSADYQVFGKKIENATIVAADSGNGTVNALEGDKDMGIFNASLQPEHGGTLINVSYTVSDNSSYVDVWIEGDHVYARTNLVSIQLKQGWNLISSPLNLTNTTEAFNPIKPSFVSMFSYNGQTKQYIKEDPFNSSRQIDLGYGLWLKVSQNISLNINGDEFGNSAIPLYSGWNLIGYTNLTEKGINISNLKNYIASTYTNSSWSSYIPNRTINSLETMKPGYGYWVKVT